VIEPKTDPAVPLYTTLVRKKIPSAKKNIGKKETKKTKKNKKKKEILLRSLSFEDVHAPKAKL